MTTMMSMWHQRQAVERAHMITMAAAAMMMATTQSDSHHQHADAVDSAAAPVAVAGGDFVQR